MCEKAILENSGTLKSVPDCYKNQEMCIKAVNNYPNSLEFVPECYDTQNMCDKVYFKICSWMTQQMCNKAVNRCFFT